MSYVAFTFSLSLGTATVRRDMSTTTSQLESHPYRVLIYIFCPVFADTPLSLLDRPTPALLTRSPLP